MSASSHRLCARTAPRLQKMSVLGACAAHARITPVYPRPSTSAVVVSAEDYAASGARQVHADKALSLPTPFRLPFGEELRDTLRLLGACMRSMQYVWYTFPAVLVYQVYIIYVYIHFYMLKMCAQACDKCRSSFHRERRNIICEADEWAQRANSSTPSCLQM